LNCITAAISTSANPVCKPRFVITSHGVCATTPTGTRGVITLAGVEYCFMYVVHDDVVDTVIGPPDYIERVVNERRQTVQEARSPPPGKESQYEMGDRAMWIVMYVAMIASLSAMGMVPVAED